MHIVFMLARLFPYWALPLGLVFAELGIHFRRRRSSTQWHCFGVVGLLAILTVLWFAFRGDLHSDRWIKDLFGVR